MDLQRLSAPWLGPLVRRRGTCRALVVVLGGLGVATLCGLKLWPCVFAEMTGLPCPGCGLTRGTLALARGDWQNALLFHPFTPFFYVVGIFVAAGALLPARQVEHLAERTEAFERKSRVTALFLGALLCFSLMRMLGFWYQPPVSGLPGTLFKRGAASGQVSGTQLKSQITQ